MAGRMVCLDASLALKLLVVEDDSTRARALWRVMRQCRSVPAIRRQGRYSVRHSRVRKRPGELDAQAVVRAGRDASGVGQLAEPASVGAHGEELAAVGVGIERVAAGLEHDCLRHRVLKDDPIVPRPRSSNTGDRGQNIPA
jgi:hypothetical protein